MHTLTITSSSHPYDAIIKQGLFDQLDFTAFDAIIMDGRVQAILTAFAARASTIPIFTINATESNKSLAMAEKILFFLNENRITKSAHILVIGGGILHDVGGLVSSLYMRGIKWSFVPTTLLAMVDACIGGKCAVNIEKRESGVSIKNLIGAIYPPQNVYIDPNFTKTLSKAQIYSGIAEIAKSAFIMSRYDTTALTTYFNLYRLINDGQNLADSIAFSLKVKKHFVEKDEFDKNERHFLNFGHTFGHAIESATHYGLEHGLAIAVGMLCAIDFAKEHFGIETNESILFQQHIKEKILAPFPFVREIMDSIIWDNFWHAFEGDKKHHAAFQLILPSVSSGVEIVNIPKTADSERHIQTCLKHCLQ